MTHKWTFMVYMAGDNGKVFDDGKRLMADLQAYGWRNIADMAKVGSTSDVAVVAQYDTLDEQQFTPRFYIDRSSQTGQMIEKIPPVSTGDPKNLTDFIVWAESHYPAERYALILWNHGTGWKEDDIFARYRERVERAIRGGETRSGSRGERLLQRALFLPTVGEIMSIEDDKTRGICYDDSSMSFLDNQALAAALHNAESQTGQRLSVLGMDACLMSMIEVGYQVRDYAEYMVGSQEVELAEGWPYNDILGDLVKTPEVSPLDLSKVIVDRFGQYYMGRGRGGGGISTQSATDLRALPETFRKVNALAELATGAFDKDVKIEIALGRAKHRVECFEDKDFADLRHLAQLMRSEYNGTSQVTDLALDLVEHLQMGISSGPIVANFHGLGRPNANGLSIYFPSKGYSPYYDRQDFASSGWNNLVRKVNQVKSY
jgi:hypothetical protein